MIDNFVEDLLEEDSEAVETVRSTDTFSAEENPEQQSEDLSKLFDHNGRLVLSQVNIGQLLSKEQFNEHK